MTAANEWVWYDHSQSVLVRVCVALADVQGNLNGLQQSGTEQAGTDRGVASG